MSKEKDQWVKRNDDGTTTPVPPPRQSGSTPTEAAGDGWAKKNDNGTWTAV